MVTISAPGKVHLMGEHAVVYGKPAFLAAVDMRIRVSVESGSETTIAPGDIPPTVGEHVLFLLTLVQKHYNLSSIPPMTIIIDSAIPFGYHLGSSAALAVATIGAVSYFLTKKWNPLVINQLAYEAEKRVHGNPSGGDNSVVTYGGFLWYRKELEFLKSIWQLPLKLPAVLDHFYVINTGKPAETTGEMVSFVHSKFKIQNSKFKKLFEDNEEQTKRIAVALKAGDETMLIDAMQKGEQTLGEMGVVSATVIPLIRDIEKSGGAVKILGGGGIKGPVGFLLAYHPDEALLKKSIEPYSYPIQKIQLGEEGVKLEKKE